jgi:hypothetical protein
MPFEIVGLDFVGREGREEDMAGVDVIGGKTKKVKGAPPAPKAIAVPGAPPAHPRIKFKPRHVHAL